MSGDPRFHELLKQIGELHDKKQRDYGADEDPFANVRASERWGIEPWVGALVRLNDKVHRLQQFAKKGELANESAEDSMLDIAVYSLIALILYREATEADPIGLDENNMCPNCVTPWKCNGPHLNEETPLMRAVMGGHQVGAPTDTFKHKPCLRCQTEGYESAGSDPALD